MWRQLLIELESMQSTSQTRSYSVARGNQMTDLDTKRERVEYPRVASSRPEAAVYALATCHSGKCLALAVSLP